MEPLTVDLPVLHSTDPSALAKRRKGLEKLNKTQLMDMLCTHDDSAASPMPIPDSLHTILSDIRDELRQVREALQVSKSAHSALQQQCIHKHIRILDLESEIRRNAVILFDAFPANADDDKNKLKGELIAKNIGADKIVNIISLGKNRAKARPAKIIFASNFHARDFLIASKNSGLKAKDDLPRELRQARKELSVKFGEAKNAGLQPKFAGGKLIVGKDAFVFNPISKVVEPFQYPMLTP